LKINKKGAVQPFSAGPGCPHLFNITIYQVNSCPGFKSMTRLRLLLPSGTVHPDV
jgi:hypothetical protein